MRLCETCKVKEATHETKDAFPTAVPISYFECDECFEASEKASLDLQEE